MVESATVYRPFSYFSIPQKETLEEYSGDKKNPENYKSYNLFHVGFNLSNVFLGFIYCFDF